MPEIPSAPHRQSRPRRTELFGPFSRYKTVADGNPSNSSIPAHWPRGKATLSILEAIRRRSAVPITEPEEPIRAELFSIERLEQHAESLAAAQRVTPTPGAAARWRRGCATTAGCCSRRIAPSLPPSAKSIAHHPGGRVAGRQLSHRRGADSRDPRRPPARLLSPAAEARRRAARRLSARLRNRLGLRRAYRQPLRPADAVPLRARLPARAAADDRRAVGGRDHAAHRAGRESAPRRPSASSAARWPAQRKPTLWPTGSWASAARGRSRARPAWRTFERRRCRRPSPCSWSSGCAIRIRRVTPALRWLDERLAAQGTTADEIVREEHQRQGAMNVTVRNVITSMRLMSAVDWAEFFESVSLVDAVAARRQRLRRHGFPDARPLPAAPSRSSRAAPDRTELDVAERRWLAPRAPREQAERRRDAVTRRERDPGYYLIAHGRRAFEKELGFRVPIAGMARACQRGAGHPGLPGADRGRHRDHPRAAAARRLRMPASADRLSGCSALLGLVPASDAGGRAGQPQRHELVRRHRRCPAWSCATACRPSLRTMVVVPTLLTTRPTIEEQIERLEVHYLASPDGDLRFALLSDWTMPHTESAPGDDELLGAAAEGIARLNRRHGPAPDGERFLLLHRRRVWNEGEGKWIGWERKRGKLHELNRLLRGATDTTFLPLDGRPPAVPASVRYVITLDADTRLPRGAAKRLVGKMAHPLNRPEFDPRSGRVVEGYAVLQPRVTPSLADRPRGIAVPARLLRSRRHRSVCLRRLRRVPGSLRRRAPTPARASTTSTSSRPRSQGGSPRTPCSATTCWRGSSRAPAWSPTSRSSRSFPSRYDVAAARQHRWARGDWQLLPWIFGRGRDRRAPACRHSADRPLEDARQPAPHAVGAGALPGPGGRLDPAARSPPVWTGFVLSRSRCRRCCRFFAASCRAGSAISKRSHLRALSAPISRSRCRRSPSWSRSSPIRRG